MPTIIIVSQVTGVSCPGNWDFLSWIRCKWMKKERHCQNAFGIPLFDSLNFHSKKVVEKVHSYTSQIQLNYNASPSIYYVQMMSITTSIASLTYNHLIFFPWMSHLLLNRYSLSRKAWAYPCNLLRASSSWRIRWSWVLWDWSGTTASTRAWSSCCTSNRTWGTCTSKCGLLALGWVFFLNEGQLT